MAVKIRLARHGAKKAPFYRIVVADGRARRDGRFIEMLGRYNPRANPSLIEVDVEKVDAWVAKGAQMTETVVKLVAIARGEKVLPEGGTAKPSKKSVARAAAEVAAAAEAEPVAEEAVDQAAEEAPAEESPDAAAAE